jgi:uncharacterized lipoprotein NlpE involved in copper resistance
MAKKLVIILLILLSFSFMGCKNKFEDISENCHRYAKQWQKEGMVARLHGWNPEEQRHYVVFARPEVDSDLIKKYTYHVSFFDGHVVYMFHRKIKEDIYYTYC